METEITTKSYLVTLIYKAEADTEDDAIAAARAGQARLVDSQAEEVPAT